MEKQDSQSNTKTKFRFIDFLLIVALIIGYSEIRDFLLLKQVEWKIADSESAMNIKLASSTDNYDVKAKELDDKITVLLGQSNSLSDNLNQQQTRTEMVASQVINVASTIGTLDKLSKTDPQLLEKYSKVFFLNENYVPSSLTNIPSQYVFGSDRVLQFQTLALPHLLKLLSDANTGPTPTLLVDSAYRSFGTQASLKNTYKVIYGAGTANSFSADQGYSEHQLGTAVDFTTPDIGGGLSGFEKTDQYTWLQNNAYKYGFVLSYPENNSYYIFEPWHWRYVGIDLANRLHRDGKNFYDMDQRDIDNYLSLIFD
jgi:LAS superfamily LD-carboxypeptidase LdcB